MYKIMHPAVAVAALLGVEPHQLRRRNAWTEPLPAEPKLPDLRNDAQRIADAEAKRKRRAEKRARNQTKASPVVVKYTACPKCDLRELAPCTCDGGKLRGLEVTGVVVDEVLPRGD